MRVLVVGSGGREHALAWAAQRAGHCVLCAPGNAGTPGNRPVAATDVDGLVRLAVDEDVNLVVVGPESPLVAGVVDALHAKDVATFGPVRAAARLEGSKAFAKAAMARWGVPHAESVTVRNLEDGIAALDRFAAPPVIKASGLAAGKGVLVPEDRAAAEAALRTMFVQRAFGAAADEVVVEERLTGREVSVLAICDGSTYRLLVPAQDHKRLADGDRGPNTGGMGAFAPSGTMPGPLLQTIGDTMVAPVLSGMEADGTPYRGVLYAGVMLTADGPRVLEYNCRFGDPECQVILPLWGDDPFEVFLAASNGRLADRTALSWADGAAVTVVMAAEGYPERPRGGDPISGIERAEAAGCVVFHAGTATSPDGPLTAGGRVLAVTATGPDLRHATGRAYAGVAEISFRGAQHRTDIGTTGPQEQR
jgi:phosphoribosylamine--glycine ligase